MIPKITQSFGTIFMTAAKEIPPKEVIITSKNGRAKVSDTFIGGYPRVSVVEAVRDLFERIFTNLPTR